MSTLDREKFLLTGANGQLGREFAQVFKSRGLDCIALGRESLDVTDSERVERLLKEIKPSVIINCSAYNLVDKAEEEPALAFKVNAEAVKNLARLSRKYGIFLVHYSTDYVFDGRKKEPYTEEDLPSPINQYGKSKLEGEEAIKSLAERFLIFRVSWVIGEGRRNFLYKLYNWAKEKNLLKISIDEVSTPTFTQDIVKVSLLALENDLEGLYHLTSSGYCSRFELAEYFLQKMRLEVELKPALAREFALPAKRPSFSALSNSKISTQLGIEISDWKKAVDNFLERFKEILL